MLHEVFAQHRFLRAVFEHVRIRNRRDELQRRAHKYARFERVRNEFFTAKLRHVRNFFSHRDSAAAAHVRLNDIHFAVIEHILEFVHGSEFLARSERYVHIVRKSAEIFRPVRRERFFEPI